MNDRDSAAKLSEPQFADRGAMKVSRLLQFLELTEEDAEHLRAMVPEYDDFAAAFVETFYNHLFSFDETAQFLKDPDRVEQLKKLQSEHFRSLLQADWSDHYAAQRRNVGRAHADVGLEPHLFLGAYSQYVQYSFRRIAQRDGQTAERNTELMLSLIKAIFLDISLTLDAYFAQATDELREALDMYWNANSELRKFAQLASHDLKTPIATVANLCDEALDEFADAMPAEAANLITAARDQAFKNGDVIDDLLESALSMQQQNARERVSSEEVIHAVINRLQPVIKEKAIDLILPASLPDVWGNRTRLREAFYNLLSNAAKFIDKTPGRIEIKVERQQSRFIFSIEDNGPGIPQGELQRIFVPFRRLAKHRDTSGSGLGLYFTLHLIERDGGQVWAESTLGEGSRFCVALQGTQSVPA